MEKVRKRKFKFIVMEDGQTRAHVIAQREVQDEADAARILAMKRMEVSGLNMDEFPNMVFVNNDYYAIPFSEIPANVKKQIKQEYKGKKLAKNEKFYVQFFEKTKDEEGEEIWVLMTPEENIN